MGLGLALAFSIALGCAPEPAVLNVALVGPALASPQYFHGNCLAGWTVRAELRVTEARGVDVRLETMSFQLSDDGSGRELGGAAFDASAIDESYGPGARIIPGGGERRFGIGGLSPERPTGPLTIIGSLSGRDENEARVESSFTASTAIEHDDSPPPAGGACAQPGGYRPGQ